jgi:hypothetical protein
MSLAPPPQLSSTMCADPRHPARAAPAIPLGRIRSDHNLTEVGHSDDAVAEHSDRHKLIVWHIPVSRRSGPCVVVRESVSAD